jgi:hypothetical protein
VLLDYRIVVADRLLEFVVLKPRRPK